MKNACLIALASCVLAGELRISEVMSNPQGSEYENEFIEVYNLDTDPINISGWLISDGVGQDSLVHLRGPEMIQPGQYGLILDPGYSWEEGPYSGLLSDSLCILTISTDASLGSGGLSNSGESVTLWNPDSSMSSHMLWETSSEDGHSWERVELTAHDSAAVWRQSLYLNGTPGSRNSVSPPDYNLALSHISIVTSILGDPVEILVRITNTGLVSVQNFDLRCFSDADQNGQQDSGEWSKVYHFSQLIPSAGQLDLRLPLNELTSGIQSYYLEIMAIWDEYSDDNSGQILVAGAYPEGCISINEIMYAPSVGQGGEWIEIVNTSDYEISLQSWTMSDANMTQHLLCDSLYRIFPGEYLVIAEVPELLSEFDLDPARVVFPETWPSLNSSSDSVRVFDATGHPVARGFYRGSWGSPGRSLERRHPGVLPLSAQNWGASTHSDLATPLGINSIILPQLALKLESITVTAQDVGPAAGTIALSFSNQGLDPLTHLDVIGEHSTAWDGALQSFDLDSVLYVTEMLPSGLSHYPLQVATGTTILADTTILITLGFPPQQLALNEILYLPAVEQAECIELVNISGTDINLEGWSISDRSGTVGVIDQTMLLQPDGYLVLGPSLAGLLEWVPDSCTLVAIDPWPSLNNGGDLILLKGPRQATQIEFEYDPDLGGTVGVSLERRALWKSAEDPASWGSSVSALGFTPGYRNSITLPRENVSLTGLQVLDSTHWQNASFNCAIEVTNHGQSTLPVVDGILQIHQHGFKCFEYPFRVYEVQPDLPLTSLIPVELSDCGWIQILVTLHVEGDEDAQDDSLTLDSYLSCNEPILLINEILPVPEEGEPEWVELFNSGPYPLELKAWTLADAGLTKHKLVDSSYTLAPNTYLVLLEGPATISGTSAILPSWPSLNNRGDELHLFDPQGIPAQSIRYDEEVEFVPGRSWERIRLNTAAAEPGNWGLSIDPSGSSPGQQNSLYLSELPTQLRVEISPNPFSPRGDMQAELLCIRYELPFEQGDLSVMIFNMAGRLIANPVSLVPVAHRGELFWDGRSKQGFPLTTGLYIIKLLFDDHQGRIWEHLDKIYLLR